MPGPAHSQLGRVLGLADGRTEHVAIIAAEKAPALSMDEVAACQE